MPPLASLFVPNSCVLDQLDQLDQLKASLMTYTVGNIMLMKPFFAGSPTQVERCKRFSCGQRLPRERGLKCYRYRLRKICLHRFSIFCCTWDGRLRYGSVILASSVECDLSSMTFNAGTPSTVYLWYGAGVLNAPRDQ